MNTQLTTKVKHIVRENMFKVNEVIQKNWFRLVVVVLIAFVIAHKDLNISFNLVKSNINQSQIPLAPIPVSNQEARPESMNYVAPVQENQSPSMKDMMKTAVVGAKKPVKKVKKKKKVDDNLANTFSNIGFILNSTYAKRNNIDPAIVAQKNKICEDYIKKYAPIAVKEMKKYGVPASITLAQGLLESNAGASKLATKNNNHFGIKCFAKSCKKGHCSNYTDDSHKDFFRAYKGVEESYHAHSLFLQRNRYKHLAKLGTKNYKDWAHGLRKAGYATDKKYAPKLIKLIEVLKLNRFDQ